MPPALPQCPLSPLPGAAPGIQDHALQADYFDGRIDLKAFGARFPAAQVLSSSPLVLEPEPGRFFHLSRFGAVISWNCPEPLIRKLHGDLQAMPGTGEVVESARDRLVVFSGALEDRVDYNEVWLRELTLEKLNIISLTLGQSVALDHFDADVNAKLAYLADAGATVTDVLSTRTSHRLEWIVIILIFIETAFFVWKEVLVR